MAAYLIEWERIMKNTYVKCSDWNWEDKLLYMKACIGEHLPHNRICGYGRLSKDELLSLYIDAWYIYCCDNGMIVYEKNTSTPKPNSGIEVRLSSLKQEKPKQNKFVKVEESIFDLKEEFERGELYAANGREKHFVINNEGWLTNAKSNGNVYRQVEIDWGSELRGVLELTSHRPLGAGSVRVGDSDLTDDEFISLCHKVAELTDKPE